MLTTKKQIELLRAAGVTQKKLAEVLKVTENTITRWKKGAWVPIEQRGAIYALYKETCGRAK